MKKREDQKFTWELFLGEGREVFSGKKKKKKMIGFEISQITKSFQENIWDEVFVLLLLDMYYSP